MIKKLWAKWRAWATIDDTIEALFTKHFHFIEDFEAYAEKKTDELLFHNAVVVKAQELAAKASDEADKAKAFVTKAKALFS